MFYYKNINNQRSLLLLSVCVELRAINTVRRIMLSLQNYSVSGYVLSLK